MGDNFSQLGIQDFFNVLFSGGYFGVSVSVIFSNLWDKYIESDMNNFKYVCIFLIFYALGLCLQEIGSFFDSRVLKIKKNALSHFLWGKEKYYNDVLRKNILFSFCSKVDRKHKLFYKDSTIINNECKELIYRGHGKDILENKEIEFGDEFTEQQSKFIYAYCLYYIEVLGKNKKYEKMRGLYDMAITLCSTSCIIGGIGICKLIMDSICNNMENLWIDILYIIVFLIVAIVFYCRAEKLMKYKTRMLMQVYDTCVDMKKEGE